MRTRRLQSEGAGPHRRPFRFPLRLPEGLARCGGGDGVTDMGVNVQEAAVSPQSGYAYPRRAGGARPRQPADAEKWFAAARDSHTVS